MSATEAPASHLRENPYEIAKTQLRRVGDVFGIDPNLVRVLSECKKIVEVSVPVVISRSLAWLGEPSGKGRSVSRVSGVTWVPKARVAAPSALAKKTPYISLRKVGAVTWVR